MKHKSNKRDRAAIKVFSCSVLQVFSLILLEKKVVVQSRDYSALTVSILSLTKLLYPLEYMFPVIPLLPVSMSGSEQLLLAPTPYIIGIPTSFLVVKRSVALPDDVWLVDLDEAKITPPAEMAVADIPALPEPEAKVLRNHLKQVRCEDPQTSIRPTYT